ncbi:MAG: helix-turn-helix transcriptional regulator [Clostridia bacterium]|nr:helix-turn-helix transcriptional regulator [Clostridia bacterium]
MILKELRKKANLTQKEVAEKIGVQPMTYNYYENGKNEPSIEMLKKIAKVFDVSIDTLLNYKSNNFDLGQTTQLQKEIIKKIINSNELICTKINAYLEGLLEGQKEQEKIITILTKGK